MQSYNSRKFNGVSLIECLQNGEPEKEAQTYSALMKSTSMSRLLNEIHDHSNKPASKSFKHIFKKIRESKSLHIASNKSLLSPKNTMEKVRKLKNEPINITITPESICKPAKKDYHLPAIVTTTKQRRHTIDLAEKESGAITDRLYNAHHKKFCKSESVYSAFTTLSSLSSISNQSSLLKRTHTTVQDLTQLAKETDEEIQYKLWNEDTSICPKKEIAKWLGSKPDTRSNILSLYMQNFDFANRDLDEAFRLLCVKLYLKGESQQLDRILVAFAHQYHHCNPNSLFYCVDIVHAVTYSLLLLNTDLHVVSDGANRMTKSSFVKNTMETIRLIAFPDLSIDKNEQKYVRQIKKSKSFSSSSLASLVLLEDVKSIHQANTIRLDAIKSNLSRKGSCIHYERRLTKVQKTWLIDIETLLKDMYTSVKSQRITQAAEDHMSTLSIFTLQRTNTFTSKKNNKKRHSLRQKKRFSATVEPLIAKETKSLPSLPTHTLKKGLVMRKHVMESAHQRARHRQWQLCYLVINSTELIMYQPLQKDQPTDSPIQKRRKSIMTWNCSLQNVVAQGDMDGWQADKEHVLDKIPMNHTYASAIPPPGWNGYRPHVFRLETAEGGLWLFESLDVYAIQAWIEAANTTAACTSKGALSGAIGNVDYGWGVNWDNSTGKFTRDSIPVWYPPTPCMSLSSLSLNDQHDYLENQIRDLHEQLDKHRALKLNLHHKLSSNCSQRVWNSMQALTNWDKKLHHLIHELIKLKSYKQNLYHYIKSTTMSNTV